MSNQYAAKILADSISPDGVRLTTFEVTMPRIVLAEFNTHRMFCLAGDAKLEFDLPGGQKGEKHKRVHRMRLDEFVDKWVNGARRTGANPKKGTSVDWAEAGKLYSAPEIAARLGMANTSSINQLCRRGDLPAVRGDNGRTWYVDGSDVREWRESVPEHTRFDMKAKLAGMRIRQLNEDTGDIQFSHVVDACYSGKKEVYEVRAGEFSVAGSRDHRVFTADGWKTIGGISVGDFLVVRKFGKRDEDKLDPLRLKKIDGRWRSVWQREKREELRAKDSRCRRCLSREGTSIHHIVPVHENPALAFHDANITLLCGPCHDIEHEEQGWQGGTYLYGSLAEVTDVAFRGEEETYDLKIAGGYANFLANGVVVHNSRNSASSRAVPVKKMVERVETCPFVPDEFGKNKRGMQSEEGLDDEANRLARECWDDDRRFAVARARELAEIGVHKQFANRLLEPFLWHTCIVTASEWSNFFHLRCHEHAHPAIRRPSEMVRELYESGEPEPIDYGEWHLPLIGPEDYDLAFETGLTGGDSKELMELMVKVSCARCARVSYLTHDGKRDLEKDLELHDRLLSAGHLSPFEHAARPIESDDYGDKAIPLMVDAREPPHDRNPSRTWCGNFRGWAQYRKMIPGEWDMLAGRE